MPFSPTLQEDERDGVHLLVDPGAAAVGVHVAFTDRRGGASAAPFDTLNLGLHVGDDPVNVHANRARAARAAGFAVADLAWARQVHGAALTEVPTGRSGFVGECDALVARETGPVLMMLTADCAPVVVAGRAGVALAHAGWRGLVAGVVEAAAAAAGPDAVAWIGPCIRACCYEVGPEVEGAFVRAGLPVAAPRRVDPAQAAAAALERSGVAHIATAAHCTSCDRRFFSYRRDGATGRQATFAAKAEGPP